MAKKISCCIPWAEYCDYPLCRKLIKERLSKCMAEIKVIIPSIPSGIDISQEQANEFYEWLKQDLEGYAIVEQLSADGLPVTTKWSGTQLDSTFSHQYLYPFEYCVDQTNCEYVARLETDLVIDEWDKIEKVFNEDFEIVVLGIGSTHRPHGDISFFVIKRDFLLNMKDITFLNLEKEVIRYTYHNNQRELFENVKDYLLIDNETLLKETDQRRTYDHYEWGLLKCIQLSNKAYLINPMKVKYHHFLGITQKYFTHRRGEPLVDLAIESDPSILRYVSKMKQEIDIDNYNLFPPYKKVIENYCEVYGKR